MASSSRSTRARRETFHLPIDVSIEILSRLPVKSLLRFKSVCKNWYALIKSPNFISKHQTQSTLNPNLSSSSLLVSADNLETRYCGMSLHCFNKYGFFDGSVNLDFPFLKAKNFLEIVGVCNGLVCISSAYYSFWYPLILCNPATQQFREIAHYKWWDDKGIHIKRVTYGFGCHPSAADDFRLIRIVYYSCSTGGNLLVRTDMFTVGTDTWREIEVKMSSSVNKLYDIYTRCASTVSNGVFYWWARGESGDDVYIVSFDLGDEVFQIIRTPECFDGIWYGTCWRFTQLKDKLALIIHPRDQRCFDVWLLNGNDRSWTCQFRVGPFAGIADPVGCGENGKILFRGCGNNGELLVAELTESCGVKLFMYDPKSHEIKNLPLFQVPYPSDMYLYTETLLPV